MKVEVQTQMVDIIDQLRVLTGREVYFYTYTVSGCSSCALDPTTDTSVDPFCSVCDGVHWVKSYVENTISGHITWATHDISNWQVGGQIFDGDCRVQIKYTDENVTIVNNSEYVIVDEKEFTIKSKILRGVRELNRIILNLIEKE